MAPPKKAKPVEEEEEHDFSEEEEEELSDAGVDDDDDDDEETTVSGVSLGDTYEDSKIHMDPRRRIQGMEVAPEVTQGPWRERAWVARGVIPKEQLIFKVDRAVKVCAMQKGTADRLRQSAKIELLPLLRQAVEQAGGDGLDAYVSQALTPPGRVAEDTFVLDLMKAMGTINDAKQQSELVAALELLNSLVRETLNHPNPKRVSLKKMDKDLEGRLETDALLSIIFSSDAELTKRSNDVERTLDSLRTQLRAMPGASPEGLRWNFSRLKIEKAMVEAERRRRTRG